MKLFALDIGTRSVVGIILQKEKEGYHVADVLTIEHKERSMIDGQIHNILQVAQVVQQIKEKLEMKHGPLHKVSVAAAGRALKTSTGMMEIDISSQPLMTTEDIYRLELAAVQQAQQALLSSNTLQEEDYYYCVGYSVLYYKLDGEEIGSLIDQAGNKASIEVIATFLPRVVVESLLSALKRAHLEMEALTLEPIAAIQALVPATMRRLNVTLVDVGAGTSDIAIANNNTIIAYGMVPHAGDEITEELSNQYLLDFQEAESLKRALNTKEEVTIKDILGFDQTILSSTVIDQIMPAVQRLATSIAKEILQLNSNQAPQAVMVVGGGSLTPGLTTELAIALDLPENRVGIRGSDAIHGITFEEGIFSSPELVTPIGIAIAAHQSPLRYMSIQVEGKQLRLFELKEMTVSDALLAANVKAKQLYGMPGLGMTILVNGDVIKVPGGHGKPTTILVNGEQSSLKGIVKNGDRIELHRGEHGTNAFATVRDIVGEHPTIHVTLENEFLVLDGDVYLNGKRTALETVLQDRDELIIQSRLTVEQLVKSGELIPSTKASEAHVIVNGKLVSLPEVDPTYVVNNEPVQATQHLKDGDHIQINSPLQFSIEALLTKLGISIENEIHVTFNDQPVFIRKSQVTVQLNGKEVNLQNLITRGDRIDLIPNQTQIVTISDVFAFSNFRMPNQQYSGYQLLRNGQPISFTDTIQDGDYLQLLFH